jgi:4-hydroxybenzoate polyprenyltransferase
VKKITGYLRLMRVPNIVTAIADILAGIAISGSLIADSYPLIISTACLYGGGVVMNDVFDADLDKIERPERAIPSGLINKSAAAGFGITLLILGTIAAGLAQKQNFFSVSFIIAVAIALAALLYDKWMKHHNFMGPVTMGFCRGCNLLLGMSLSAWSLQHYWYIAIVPVIYIAAITMISRGEVHGGKRTTLYLAALFYIVVILAILLFSFFNETLEKSLAFVTLFCFLIFLPLQKAILKPEGPRIGKAVKSGVIALIAMNAAWAAAFGDLYFAILIIVLLPLSLLLAKGFAVT